MPEPGVGFLCGLLCCRNCEYAGSEYGIKYPINPKKLLKMGPAWLTQALRAAGTISDRVSVKKIELKTPDGAGLLSELAFIEITYNTTPPKTSGHLAYNQKIADLTLPTNAVVKFAPMLLKTRATVDVFELIKTEFTFYNTVMREMVPFVVPKVFYADMNFRSNNACMVLEKVKGEFRDQLEQPATIEDARIIVTKMAQLGAKWNGPVKSNYDEVQFCPAANGPVASLIPPEAGKHKKKVFGKSLAGTGWTYEIPEQYAELFDDMVANGDDWLNFAASNPATLGVCHGDTRLDNFFFYTADDGNVDCGMLDFQMLSRSDITTDLAWFLGTSCSPEFQAKYDEELFDLYLAELGKAGGPVIEKGTEERAMWEESYSLGFTFLAFKCIIGAGGIDVKQPKAVPLCDMLLKSMMSMVERRNVCETYMKFRAGDLIAQKRYPWIAKKFGQRFTKLKGYKAPSAAGEKVTQIGSFVGAASTGGPPKIGQITLV